MKLLIKQCLSVNLKNASILLTALFIWSCDNLSESDQAAPQDPSPNVIITYPPDYGQVKGITPIRLELIDFSAVSHVVLMINGDSCGVDTTHPYGFEWMFNEMQSSHTIMAKAFDRQRRPFISRLITVYTDLHLSSPRILISTPADYGLVQGLTPIRFNITGLPAVEKMILFIDGDSCESDTAAPYEFNHEFSTDQPAHTILAKAIDRNNLSVMSQLVTVYTQSTKPSPQVVITYPPSWITVRDSVNVNTLTTTYNPVSSVVFFVDGDSVHSDQNYPYSFQWRTSGLKGIHSLTAMIADNQGQHSVSQPVYVYTDSSDISPPVCVITYPVNQQVVSGTINVRTQSADNQAVDRAEFFVDGNLTGTNPVSPYYFSWNTQQVNNGAYTLLVKMYDKSGNASLSQLIICLVQN